jgi:hypothetical protein
MLHLVPLRRRTQPSSQLEPLFCVRLPASFIIIGVAPESMPMEEILDELARLLPDREETPPKAE